MLKNLGIWALLCFATIVCSPVAGNGQVNVTTWHNDNWRTGQNTGETVLKTNGFTNNGFGKLCRISLPSSPQQEEVYAQPLLVANNDGSTTVYVATMQDNLYVFKIPSAANWTPQTCGQIQSQATPPISLLRGALAGQFPADVCLIGNGSKDTNSCSRAVCPSVGVMGTPVIDTLTSTMYLVTESHDTDTHPEGINCQGKSNSVKFRHYLHALDLTSPTLAEKSSGPVLINPPGGNAPFDSQKLLQRPGLLFIPTGIATPTQPTVYAAFAMMDGTRPNPSGWVLGWNGGNLAVGGTPLVFDTSPNAGVTNPAGGGVWQGGASLAAGLDGNNNNSIYLSTADGVFDASNSNYGDSFLKLNTDLELTGSFTPADWFYRWDPSCSGGQDLDLGSAGTMLVPDGLLATPYGHVAIKGEKEPNLWVIDRTNPGGTGTGCTSTCVPCSGTNPVLQEVAAPNPAKQAMTTPTFWFDGTTPFMYFAQQQEQIYQYKLNCNPGPICTPAAASTNVDTTGTKMGYAAIASVSSKGTTSGTGIVWAIKGNTANGTVGLYAFDAENLHTLYQPSGCPTRDAITPTKFSVPTVANGYVFVGAQTDIDIYGLNPGTCN